MQRYQNKTIFITGAASGIGRATAIRLAEEGGQLMLADLDLDGLTETVKLIENPSAEIETMALDVSSPEACRNAIAQAVERFGKLDMLCNIAGIALCRRVEDITEDEWMRTININLNGVFFLSQAAMPHLLKTKGNIVNMASSAALVGQVYNAAYCASKAGVSLLSKSLAVEFARQGVRVNAICPGSVATPLAANFTMPENPDMDLFGKLLPLLDTAQPEEIAAAIAYIGSDEARFVTGIDFPIDGGQTAC